MKKLLGITATMIVLAACGNNKTDTNTSDSLTKPLDTVTPVTGAGLGVSDSLHPGSVGARVNPIDTSNPNKSKP